MGFQLFHVFWNADCDSPGPARVKRLADINTETHVGGGQYTQNDPTYTLINIHGPTATLTLGLVAVFAVIAALLFFLHRRRQKRLKGVVARHRAAKWDAIGYHKNECSKIDHAKPCDCKPTRGHYHRRASNGGDLEEPDHRRCCVIDG